MARRLTLSGTKLTDTTAPRIILRDRIETAGSLVLIDLTHPSAPWAEGLPAAGAAVPNVLEEFAAEATGRTSGHDALFHLSGTPAKVARTLRGGHYVSGSHSGATIPAATIDHLIANPSHAFYVSQWAIRHEAVSGSNYAGLVRLDGSTGTGGVGFVMNVNSAIAAATSTNTSGFPVPQSAYRIAAAFPGVNIAGTTAAAIIAGNGARAFGSIGGNGPGARTSYRFYMEDLTISGRTFAEVNAIDADLYSQEVLTAGGRYYGDSVPA